MRSQASQFLVWSSAVLLALLLSGVATPAARGLPAAGQSGTPPIPSGFKLVASDRGNASNGWMAAPDVTVFKPLNIEIRVTGRGKISTDVIVSCSVGATVDRTFKGAGLFKVPIPAGESFCVLVVDSQGTSSLTAQVYAQTRAATATTTTTTTTTATTTTAPGTTTPPPASPSKAYDGTWQGRIYGYIEDTAHLDRIHYRDSCCDVWSFTVSDGKISGEYGTSGSISSTGAAAITITSESNKGCGCSIVCTFQVQFTSTSAKGGPTSCETGGFTLTINEFDASPKTPQAPPPTTTTPKGTSPYCVKSNDGSSNGWNYYKYVDTTSTAPCYGHWTITLGPGCQFDDGDGHGWYSSGPANVWNIVRWGYYGSGGTVAYLWDGRRLLWSCTINAASYPQTTRNSADWG